MTAGMLLRAAACIAAIASLPFFTSCSSVRDEKPGSPAKVEEPAPPVKDEGPRPLTEKEVELLKKMGGEVLPDQNIKLGDVTIHRKEMELSFPAVLNLTSGPLEVLICMPAGRMHESLLLSKTPPMELQLALILLGAVNGPRQATESMEQGAIIDIDVKPEGGQRVPVESWVFDNKRKAQMRRDGWIFIGASFGHGGVCMADELVQLARTLNICNAILDNPSEDKEAASDIYEVYGEKVPAFKTPVTVYFKPRR